MLAVILVLVVGTIRLVGSNANNVFSQVFTKSMSSPVERVLVLGGICALQKQPQG